MPFWIDINSYLKDSICRLNFRYEQIGTPIGGMPERCKIIHLGFSSSISVIVSRHDRLHN